MCKNTTNTCGSKACSGGCKARASALSPVSDVVPTNNQRAMLHILALGRTQIEEGKVTQHDDVFARFEAEDNAA